MHNNLIEIYKSIAEKIESRIDQFKNIWVSGTEEEIFSELAFCIFTPQSKAKNCWQTVEILKENNLLFTGTSDNISRLMNLVRFRNNKAKYLVSARNFFLENNMMISTKISRLLKTGKEREWLVNNIKGIGYKESSHFLRNIGANLDHAILDRHILKNLNLYGIIDKIPKTLTKRRYLEIEIKMQEFSKKINIPISHLDLLLWYKEAGEVFK